jgi:thiamine-phosphate pyrophosphorylase
MAVVTTADSGLRAPELGATVVQLRNPAATTRELEREAAVLVERSTVPVLVSSRVDVALAVGAAGVNLPEDDFPVGEARRLLGPDRLVGRSVHSVGAAREAEEEGADYVLFGPVFASASHPARPAAGLAALAGVAAAVRIPVLGIGGIDRERAQQCLAHGASGFAAISLFERERAW